jgi:type II secretory pathway component PulK
VWLTNTDKQLMPVTKEILRVFCSWYGIDEKDVTEFRQRLDEVAKIKPFSPNAAAFNTPVQVPQTVAPPAATPSATRAARNAAAAKPATPVPQPTKAVRSGLRTYSDYSKLMKSTYLNADWLTIPAIDSITRQEYPMKYLGVWGSTKVNINTAPRHVLEAAFAFGGDGDKIADALIMQRREKPFTSIDEFRRKNIGYGGQIQKCENYITTQSDVFTIRITATNGPAKCTAIAAVLRNGQKINAVFE